MKKNLVGWAAFVAVVAVCVAGWGWRGRDLAAAEWPAARAAASEGAASTTPQRPAQRQRPAKLGPHPQANLPPLELPGYQLPRAHEVVRAVYRFAAEHPEVLNYMPCYCGCEHEGHRSNEDCFVKTRAKNGDVTEWTDHGMVCAMCLAVGEQAMRMHAAGASLPDIGAEVERKFGHITETRTPTPPPPRK